VALECAASIVRDVIEKACRMHVGLLVSIGFLLKYYYATLIFPIQLLAFFS
jgi:hypothetical protein